ncbi:MAG: glycosyl hydrolase-related protein, partial [Clostridia bacterium]
MSLDRGSACLDYQVECEWLETGKKNDHVPQLDFHVKCAYPVASYRYDIPFGTIDREPAYMNVPALNACMARNGSNPVLSLVSDDKYGFRGDQDAISLSLLRSSYDPDPHPELGMHTFRFSLLASGSEDPKAFLDAIRAYRHPLNHISGGFHPGTLPLQDSFMEVDNANAMITCVKPSETLENGILVRFMEVKGQSAVLSLRIKAEVKTAYLTDVHEAILEELTPHGKQVSFDTRPYGLTNLLLSL